MLHLRYERFGIVQRVLNCALDDALDVTAHPADDGIDVADAVEIARCVKYHRVDEHLESAHARNDRAIRQHAYDLGSKPFVVHERGICGCIVLRGHDTILKQKSKTINRRFCIAA